MKHNFTFPTLLLCTLLSLQGLLAQNNNDCVNAIVICSDDNIGTNPTGPGANDFADGDNFDGCLSGENQSGWYYFEIQPDAPAGLMLGFTINPDAGSGQDYDFAVFGPDVPCDNLGNPIRCSYAGGGCALCPQTGLGMGATDNSESPSGNGFVAMLTVQPGEGYYLLIDNFSNNSTGFSLTWTGPAAPWLNCIDCDAEAGMLTANPTPACPGSTINFEVSGHNTDPEYTQLLLVADENGDFIDIINGTTGMLSSDVCAEFTIYSYNYETGGGSVVPFIGDNISSLDCSVECCDLEELMVSFEDTEAPTFPFAPGDITITCADLLPTMDDQEWIDNCDGNGFVSGSESGVINDCDGGTITRVWEYTDACDNLGFHEQTITVEPTPEADFINPPGDITVSCAAAPSGPGPDLAYTNNASGSCEISGMEAPVQTGSSDLCGGTITYTWEVIDPCGRPINHVQTITVEPAPEAAFINPPPSQTISCSDIPTGPPADLDYTNNESGICAIAGSVPAIVAGSADQCGGTITYTWTFTDDCDRTIDHVQTITVDPAPEAAFVNPPGNLSLTCNDLPTLTAPDLAYTNGETGICAIAGVRPPVQSGSADECGGTIMFTWSFTDDCGRPIDHVQTVTIAPAPQAAFTSLPTGFTITCTDLDALSAPDLDYTNNESGDCAIAGTVSPIQSGNADECGGTITFTWSFTDDCGRPINHAQVVTVEPAPEAVFIDLPADVMGSCDNLPSGTAAELFYTNNETGSCAISGSVLPVQDGFADVCGGDITFTWTFIDDCGRPIDYVQTYSVDPVPPASFVDLPQNMTLTCDEVPDDGDLELAYDNGFTGDCELFGQVAPAVDGFIGICGGTLTYTWEYTDPCGRFINWSQVITVEPGPAPVFLDAPENVTVSCNELPPTPPELFYDNSTAGNCEIFGVVEPDVFGSADECGGSITYSWSITDPCGEFIEHIQIITVEPAPDPVFIDPPADGAVDCNADFPTPPDLFYENGSSGDCAVSGSVPATITVISPTEEQYNWEFTAPCSGETITHTQTVTRDAPPDITLSPVQTTICAGESYDLADITITDETGDGPTITFHSSSPATPANALAETLVSPTDSTVYYVQATNAAGCADEEAFTVLVETPPNAGGDGNGIVCFELAAGVALPPYLTGNPDTGGAWFDTDATGVSLADPDNVNLSTLAPGQYQFTYIAPATAPCTNDSAVVTLVLLPPITVEVLDITCTSDLNFYDVNLNGNGFVISATGGGTLSNTGGDQYVISGIPIANTVSITASNPIAVGCETTFSISPPDCNCPNVAPPVSDGSPVVCAGEPNPALSVSVAPDQTANWYTEASGGTAFLSGSLTFTPDESAPGVYEYFVESETLVDGCTSSIHTLVSFEIVENPTGNDAELMACDTDQDGLTRFDLTLAQPLINGTPGLTFRYFTSLAAAEANDDFLDTDFINTNPLEQELFVRLENADGCSAIVSLRLLVNLPLDLMPVVQDESCLGAADGSMTVGAAAGALFSLDSVNWTTDNIFNDLAAGDYTVYAESGEGCFSSQNFTVAPGMELLLGSFEVVCNPNGTFSDETDDFYTISFTGENTLALTGTFTVNDGTADWGSFAYGSPQSVDVPANGQSFSLTFTDDVRGCPLNQDVGPLNSCSSDCLISIDELTFVCDDNGTDTNPDDDFYTITISASAFNGSASGTYRVLAGGMVISVNDYGETVTFTLPADGSSPDISVVDSDEPSCTVSQPIGPLNTCSGDCTLELVVSNVRCDDGGTSSDPSDDVFFYDVLVTGTNVSDGWLGEDGFSGTYGTPFTFGPYPITGGDQVITVTDELNPNCPVTRDIPAPMTCSNDCVISLAVLEVSCNDNNTVSVLTDDFYEVTVDADIVNGGGTGNFEVLVDGDVVGTFAYGMGGMITLPADGSSRTITIQDEGEPGCALTESVGPLLPCNVACTIAGVFSNIRCDDSGTNDPADDTFSFDLLVTGENVSSNWANSIDGTLRPYGMIATFGPFPISAGDLVFDFNDAINSGCNDQLTVPAPATCSPTCSLVVTNLNVVCNDNGTVSQQNDDFYDITIDATATNGGPSGNFVVLVDDLEIGTYSYGTGGSFSLPANGSSPVIEVRDETETGCSVTESIGPLVPCTDECIIQASVTDETCDDLGTGADSTDDTYTFSLRITGQNTSAQWVSEDGTFSGQYGTTITAGPFLISEGNRNITVFDQVNPDCRTTFIVVPPAACSFCNQSVNAGPDAVLSCIDDGFPVVATTSFPGTYVWTRNGMIISDQLEFFADGVGTYVLTATYPDGCVATDSLVITSSDEIPAITQIEIIPERCEGENNGRIIIEEISGGQSPYNYALNGQEVNTAGFFTRLEPGDYTVLVTDANGCQTDTLITIESGPDLKITEPLYLEIMQGDSGMIQVEVSVPETELRSIQWTPPEQLTCDSCLTTGITAENSQNYILEVIHENGCIVSTSVYVLARQDLDVFIPNVFSPNGDGTNDFFTLFAGPRVVEVESMIIFDRWGENVFTATNFAPNDPNFGWDGNLDGEPMNPQVFVYSISLLLRDGTKETFKGDFVLMR